MNNQYYNNAPFDEAEKSRLESSFLGVFDVFGMSIELFKNKWKGLYLNHFCISLLIFTVFVVAMVLLALLGLSSANSSSFVSVLFSILVGILLSITLLVVLVWVQGKFQISLNNQKQSLLSAPNHFGRIFLSALIILGISFCYGSIVGILDLVVSLVTLPASSTFGSSQDPLTIATAGLFGIGIYLVFYIFRVLCDIIYSIFASIFMKTYLFEDNSVGTTFELSWKIFKKFWIKDFLRRFLASLLVGIGFGSIVGVGYLVIILVGGGVLITGFSSPSVTIFAIAISILFLVVFVILSYFVSYLMAGFDYICFYNMRALYGKDNNVNDAIRVEIDDQKPKIVDLTSEVIVTVTESKLVDNS
jgi:hypothetical protein